MHWTVHWTIGSDAVEDPMALLEAACEIESKVEANLMIPMDPGSMGRTGIFAYMNG